jgi:hypothetical protein
MAQASYLHYQGVQREGPSSVRVRNSEGPLFVLAPCNLVLRRLDHVAHRSRDWDRSRATRETRQHHPAE